MRTKKYNINSGIYFIVAAILIAYFFPREGKFRYQFYEGKPWRYGLLTAPSDFPIYKTDAQVQAEKDSILKQFEPYFQYNASVEKQQIDLSFFATVQVSPLPVRRPSYSSKRKCQGEQNI